MTNTRIAWMVTAALAAMGCSKKDEGAAPASGGAASATPGGAATATSGLAWTPAGYDAMSATCKKALACCEEIAKTEGAKSADDFNLKCSGPATWKDGDCDVDLKARVAGLEAATKPVPDACK